MPWEDQLSYKDPVRPSNPLIAFECIAVLPPSVRRLSKKHGREIDEIEHWHQRVGTIGNSSVSLS